MVTWTFVDLDEVRSTQLIAKELASMGAPEGTTIVAKSQSSGGGRLGRAWASPTGGLYMSFVLRPAGVSRPELVTLVTTLAVVEGVKHATTLDTAIRWPNDVMVSGRKLAGVIAEAVSYNREITQVVVGIGVNCNAPVSKIRGLEDVATSLTEELGRDSEIHRLRHSILSSFSLLYERWRAGEDMLPQWKQHLATIGRSVSIKLKTDETPFPCQALDIDPEGGLVVVRGGSPIIIHAEDLDWLRELV